MHFLPARADIKTMQSWNKLLVVWLLALLLPLQSLAAMNRHCSEGSVRPEVGAVVAVDQARVPCAHHMKHEVNSKAGSKAGSQADSPAQWHSSHAQHGADCAACCAVPVAQLGVDAVISPVIAAFPPVIDQFAQFVPPGLKRPPSPY
jgi:hypothetical protein